MALYSQLTWVQVVETEKIKRMFYVTWLETLAKDVISIRYHFYCPCISWKALDFLETSFFFFFLNLQKIFPWRKLIDGP